MSKDLKNSEPAPVQSWSVVDLLANKPFIISLLYLASFFVVFSAIVGVVLAHVYIEGEAEEWEESHFPYLIRTFWLLIGVFVFAAIALLFVFIALGDGAGALAAFGFGMLMLAALILSAVRTIYAMINAVKHKPMPRPRTLLI